ncbi:MAG TPA: DUF86 domain-containing protein [bacterium]|jgi:uncharacterized protein YutE (UPF0331/DUF86 family)|nr:DUF86 domain-containing protein [bacterium]MDX9805014.1 DUF86 domain-containing protein [bacterium]HNW15459.1 DUF86 domain-containing protein [bacterium]HNZ53121.1 DUF86 domain-containing protein [bacterium]HOG43846.1 DUF86 domain-containing protein [bacterium]
MEVVLDKISSIKRCVERIVEEYQDDETSIMNITKQDSIVLNLQRACELSIDIANYIISRNGLEVPKTTRESFAILERHEIIDGTLSDNLQKMVGFRNIAVHNYKKLSLEILSEIIRNNLNDFEIYSEKIIELMKGGRN